MEFDQRNLRPTYRLLVGVPGTSSGIEIARRLGLPARVVDHAHASLSPESREARDLIAYLHRSRDEMEEVTRQAREQLVQLDAARRDLQTEWIDRQKKRIVELEKHFAAIAKKLEGDVQRLAVDMKDRALRAQLEKQSGRRFAKLGAEARAATEAAVLETLASSHTDLGPSVPSAATPLPPEKLSPGLRVRVKGLRQAAIFRRHDGRTAEVEAGPLRMKIPLTDITGIEGDLWPARSATTGQQPGRTITLRAQPSEEAPSAAGEINVIGCTVEEATRRVDKFLDQAAIAGRSTIRIIHGHGTGALRRGLAEFLAAHPLVESTRHEAEDRGGTAITIAELSG